MSFWIFGGPEDGPRKPLYSITFPIWIIPFWVAIIVSLALPLVAFLRNLLRVIVPPN